MEETTISVPSSIWTSLNGWFTSTVFFILLNVMIATIVFTSNLPTNNNNQPQEEQEQEQEQEEHQQQKHNQKQDSNNNKPQVSRSPSILNRIKSFNFSQISPPGSDPDIHYQENPLEVAATQFVFNQPLQYQHFDFDTVDPAEEIETDGIRFEFDLTHQETEMTRFDYDLVNSGQETKRGLTSFDFEPTHEEREMTHFDFDPNHEVTRQDSGFEEETDEFESLDDVYSKLKSGGGHVDRSKSDGDFASKVPANPAAAKMRKSASMKVGFSNTESVEKVEARRPATSRKAVAATAMDEDEDEVHEDDVEVDAKADDFINKFKNDLKLQRIESIMKKNGGKK